MYDIPCATHILKRDPRFGHDPVCRPVGGYPGSKLADINQPTGTPWSVEIQDNSDSVSPSTSTISFEENDSQPSM